MKKTTLTIFTFALTIIPLFAQKKMFVTSGLTPPKCIKKPKVFTEHGSTRTDDYYWLNERDNPQVKAYLEAENAYVKAVMKPTEALQEQLFQELKGRIKEDDSSIPYFKNGYLYYTRYEAGKEYPIHCRKKGSEAGAEEIMLNVNELAVGKKYIVAAGMDVSPDNRLMFYALDTTGRNLFQWYIRDLTTGKDLPDSGESAQAESAWANDNKSFFYVTKDATTLRSNKVWRHILGTEGSKDELVYEEKDETTYAFMYKTKSDKYIVIASGYTQIVECHFIDADEPTMKPVKVHPREKDLYYTLDHYGDKFYIRTNKNAVNFKLVETPVAAYSIQNWKDVIPHRNNVLLNEIQIFKDYLVVSERKGGLNQLRVIRWKDKSEHYLNFGEPTYGANFDANPEFDTQIVRYGFSSLKTPYSVFDYDMSSRSKKRLKVNPVLGGFDSKNYETAYVFATAADGTKIPISLVWRKGTKRDGSAPMHLTGYGSYGSSYDPYFNRDKLSLLDRGFVCGIAHIRGGMEMGYGWYEEGKMLKKKNTFTDFIACAKFLIKNKYTSDYKLFIEGRSAGGLLMGAVVNMTPHLFRGVIVGVPFVDVITTMSDPSIPLTTGEYTEWGNPSVKAEYEYMKSYSPYDNLSKKRYPNMLVTTSFSDSQVQYFEPAKWVAKLREYKTDNNLLLFETNMSGSHGGSSGRFERLRERAKEYAFMLGLLETSLIK